MEYEPAIQKQLHRIPTPAIQEHVSICKYSSDAALPELSRKTTSLEKEDLNESSHLQFSLLFPHLELGEENRSATLSKGDLSSVREVELGPSREYTEARIVSSKVDEEDHRKLLKTISKVLDENANLKKQLEICNKIINHYQSSFETNQGLPLF